MIPPDAGFGTTFTGAQVSETWLLSSASRYLTSCQGNSSRLQLHSCRSSR